MKLTYMKKIFKIFLLSVLISIGYFFVGKAPSAKEIVWGVNFSQKQAENLKLDWRETYLALLDDLGARNIKLVAYWDLIEPEKDKYNFNDLDWQIKKAEEKGANLILVIGMKTPRWPECHIPEWVKISASPTGGQNLLNYIEKVVNRYKDSKAIWAWQVENEPFFSFGECPKIEKDFLKKEVELVKSLDTRAAAKGEDEGKPRRGQTSSTIQNRPVIISDSGEWSFWIKSAKLGDIAGATMYKKTWFPQLRAYVSYPFPPVFYWRKAQIVKKLFNKEVIVTELQAEPWCSDNLYNCPLKEQEKTMNLAQFKNNIEFSRSTGLKEFYLWGGEWWYWMKEKQDKPEIWNEAKKLF
jgi:hypothetical protein